MPGSLVRKLEQFTKLSEAEKRAIGAAPTRIRLVGLRQDIVSDGSQPTDISLISDGFACRYKVLDDGRRQILAFLIPGDICDLRALLLRRIDFGVAALSACQITVIPHQRLFDILEKHPRLALTLWANTMVDAAIYRQWLTNVGRHSAHERIAHLLCEMCHRLHAVGFVEKGRFKLPVTQTDIGDATGLSTVHVNRVIQDLRSDQLITIHSNIVVVLDWERLKTVGEFDPSYLGAAAGSPQNQISRPPISGQ
jgi:CRP-like cAMP-binding protein